MPEGHSANPDKGHEAWLFAQAFLRFARWRAASAALLIGLGGLADGIGLLLLVPVLGIVVSPATTAGIPLLHPFLILLQAYDQTQRLLLLLGGFALLVGARCLIHALRDRAIARLQLEFVETIRLGLIDRLAKAPWRNVAGIRHTRIIQALGMEIYQLGIAANSGLLAIVALAMLLSYGILALVLSPLAGALTLLLGIVSALVSRPYVRRARTLGRSIVEAHFGQTDNAMLFLNGLKLAVAQGLQQEFAREYGAASSAAMRDRLAYIRQQSRLRNILTAMTALVAGAALFAGMNWFHLPLPVLIGLLVALSRMNGPAQIFQQGVQNLLHGMPAYRTILSLEAELGAPGREGADPAKLPAGGPDDALILLRDVSFHHEGADARGALLEKLDLAIPVGAFVGISGPSGAGKTSFLDLVAGIITPQKGSILVHGRALCGPDLAAHRERLAYVTQDSFLFDDTIRRNLAWSRPDASETEMLHTLERVGAGALLARLDQGLDTRVGERGTRISAGERQRLGLARALLRRPALLILDEATNAIDIAGERSILAAMAALTPHMTILMVAHRRESLEYCDWMLRFPGPTLVPVVPRWAADQNVQETPPVSTVLL